MPDAHTFGIFVVARGVEGWRAAGMVSVVGITVGGLVHTAFAAVGLSALLASSAAAFSVVKWLGVAYLIYLGIGRLLARDEGVPAVTVEREPLRGVFWQGVVNVLNPKLALLFLAFLPQFVDPSRGPVWAQVLVLGLTCAAVGLCTDGLLRPALGYGRRLAAAEEPGLPPGGALPLGRDVPRARGGERGDGIKEGVRRQRWTSA